MSSKENAGNAHSQSDSHDAREVFAASTGEAKRSYASPQLRRLGSVRELTLGVTTGPFEVSMMGA